MKKSKLVTIGLLALSIAACHRKHSSHQSMQDWQDDSQNAYISTDGGMGYTPVNSGLPFWFYYYALYNSAGRVYYYPGVVYHVHNYGRYSTGSRSSYGVSQGGRSYRGGSIRGGFGSSGRSISA